MKLWKCSDVHVPPSCHICLQLTGVPSPTCCIHVLRGRPGLRQFVPGQWPAFVATTCSSAYGFPSWSTTRAFNKEHHMRSRREQGARASQDSGKIFVGQLLRKIRAFLSGKNHVKFGNFVNFSGKYHKNSGILLFFSVIFGRAEIM